MKNIGKKLLICISMLSILTSCNKEQKQNETKSLASESSVSIDMIEKEAKRQQDSVGSLLEINKILETQWICAGTLPTGWLKIGGQWNPTQCGNPTHIYENVWLIERYDNKPVGSVMTVCAQPIPSGWVKIGGSWNPTACGSPTHITENVIKIKRLS